MSDDRAETMPETIASHNTYLGSLPASEGRQQGQHLLWQAEIKLIKGSGIFSLHISSHFTVNHGGCAEPGMVSAALVQSWARHLLLKPPSVGRKVYKSKYI